MTLLGCNFPYDYSGSSLTWTALNSLAPTEITIMSHTSLDVLGRLLDEYPSISLVHVRSKTGWGNQGYWPGDILDYKEWENEVSLRETIEYLLSRGRIPYIILGNEPDIELTQEPVNSPDNMIPAIYSYIAWFGYNRNHIKEIYPDIPIAVAPLSLGDPNRYFTWASTLAFNGVYRMADFFAGHIYTNGEEENTPEFANWVGMIEEYRVSGLPVHITELGVRDNISIATEDGLYSAIQYLDGKCECISLFTIHGGTQDASKPEWWFIYPDEMLKLKNLLETVVIEEKEVKLSALDEARSDMWGAYPVGTGFYRNWKTMFLVMGSPMGVEHEERDDDGNVVNVYQAFSRGVYRYNFETGLVELIKDE